MIIIKNWTTRSIIYQLAKAKTVCQAVIEAAKCGANLRGSRLRDADLCCANLNGADLNGAELRYAGLSGARLNGADLSGVPVIANIHQAVYKAVSVPDALDMDQWHTCETTHCRGGWVINLAGAGGAALECEMGTSAAAAFIYIASDPCLEKIPDFHCDNETALIDMQRLADKEAEAQSTGEKHGNSDK